MRRQTASPLNRIRDEIHMMKTKAGGITILEKLVKLLRRFVLYNEIDHFK